MNELPPCYRCGKQPTLWQGCYDEGWRGLIVDDAYAHPAKFARGLIRRIYRHLRDRYGLPVGSVVVDPFGGVALGALDAMEMGYAWVGCELEARFVALGEQNLAKWRPFHPGATAVLVQGDSRELRRDVGEAACVVGSPPYAETLRGDGSQAETAEESRAKRRTEGGSLGQSCRTSGYGGEGNLGNLKAGSVEAVIGSPPFADSDQPCASQTRAKKDYHAFTRGDGTKRDHQMQSAGNLASLPAGSVEAACDAVVGSPPFDKQMNAGGCKGDPPNNVRRKWAIAHGRNPDAPNNQQYYQNYGDTPGNIGNATGQTFWEAARLIVAETFAILRPGGIAVWVCKSFVRASKIVDFPGDWRRLCESCGFDLVEEVHASLVKTDEHPGLFGEPVVKKKARKSFFRRLHEAKRPDLAIDYEVVLFLRKPSA